MNCIANQGKHNLKHPLNYPKLCFVVRKFIHKVLAVAINMVKMQKSRNL